jgi:hypothetical protein
MNDKQKPVLKLSNDEWLMDLCFFGRYRRKTQPIKHNITGKR